MMSLFTLEEMLVLSIELLLEKRVVMLRCNIWYHGGRKEEEEEVVVILGGRSSSSQESTGG